MLAHGPGGLPFSPVSKRKDIDEERAIKLLERVLDIDRADRDALPGSAVKKVKEALTILRKRRRREPQATAAPEPR